MDQIFYAKSGRLKLNDNAPNVIAAHDAEQQLFNFYNLNPQTHYIMLSGSDIRMRVSEIGTGEPLVIIPGNTGDVFPLIPLIAQLTGRRVLAINRPGGGLSEGMDHHEVKLRKFAVRMITSVVDYFKLDSAHIVAHSIGGHFSFYMAMDCPQRVKSLTLLGVPGNIISTGPPFALRLIAVPVINRLLVKLIKPKSAANALRGLSFVGHSKETLNRLPHAFSECYYRFQQLPHYDISLLSLMEQASAMFGEGIKITEDELKEVKQPILFLWGTNDPFGSIEIGKKIAGYVPSSVFHPIQNAGHLPWLDSPVESGNYILDFLSDK